MSLKKKFLIFLIIVGLGVAALGYYYYQRNLYSRSLLRIEIFSQETPQAFDEIEYLVKYKNNGNIVLEEAQLIFQYPENSLPSQESSNRVVKQLDDIYPGEERTVSLKGRLIGREGDKKEAKAVLRYRPRNLKAVYESSTTFTSIIKSVPINFEFDIPSRLESGKEAQFSLNYFSNSDWPIADLRVKVDYPSGFEFISSRPQALEKTEWDIPLLNKTEGGRIEIKGKILGEIKERKSFKAQLGLWREGNFILLKEIIKGIEIIRPAISVLQRINDSTDYIASPGQVLHYEIFFRNIGQEPFENLFLVARLEGAAFDFDSLRTESGKFNKGENFILWDWSEVPKLKFLAPGEEGKVEFWITLKENWDISSQGGNASLKNQVVISQVRENFETRINSRLNLSQKGYFHDEVFGNTGPFPPATGQTTTFTIIWEVKNYYNDAEAVKVKAVLPYNVKLTGKIFPEGAPLTFDSQSREVVWSPGKVEAGTGIKKQSQLVAFQVAFTPQDSNEIVGQAQILGQDTWTGRTLESTQEAVTINNIQ